MEHLVTLAAAILGSSILSTAVGFIAARYNPTRHVETLQAWNTERLLLSELESKAGIIDDEASTSARNVALATAARTQVNAAVTTRLIPKNSLSSSVALVSGLLLSLLAATAIIAGIFFGLYLSDTGMRFLSLTVALSGLVIALMAALLIFIGHKSDVYRNIMRLYVRRILNGEPEPKEPYPKKNPWTPGYEPEYLRGHRIALPPEVRQSFSYFMKNATESVNHGDTMA